MGWVDKTTKFLVSAALLAWIIAGSFSLNLFVLIHLSNELPAIAVDRAPDMPSMLEFSFQVFLLSVIFVWAPVAIYLLKILRRGSRWLAAIASSPLMSASTGIIVSWQVYDGHWGYYGWTLLASALIGIIGMIVYIAMCPDLGEADKQVANVSASIDPLQEDAREPGSTRTNPQGFECQLLAEPQASSENPLRPKSSEDTDSQPRNVVPDDGRFVSRVFGRRWDYQARESNFYEKASKVANSVKAYAGEDLCAFQLSDDFVDSVYYGDCVVANEHAVRLKNALTVAVFKDDSPDFVIAPSTTRIVLSHKYRKHCISVSFLEEHALLEWSIGSKCKFIPISTIGCYKDVVVAREWEHKTASGERDRRFKDNRLVDVEGLCDVVIIDSVCLVSRRPVRAGDFCIVDVFTRIYGKKHVHVSREMPREYTFLAKGDLMG